MKLPDISVVIPSYNEMANLQKGTLIKVRDYLHNKKYAFEVIVVDDGSNDGSREYVENFSKDHPDFRLVKNNHTGKAGAVTAGMLAAKGNLVLFTDMDQATPIEEMEKFFPYFKQGFDIVIGSRPKRVGDPLTRKIMSKSTIVLRKLIVGLSDIRDTQCGFKMFRKEVSDDIFSRVQKINNGFKTIKGSAVTAGFDMELLYLATKSGYKIKEVPVEWLYVETRRVNPVTDSIKGFRDLILIRLNINKGIYSR